jgi:hypothetical protein
LTDGEAGLNAKLMHSKQDVRRLRLLALLLAQAVCAPLATAAPSYDYTVIPGPGPEYTGTDFRGCEVMGLGPSGQALLSCCCDVEAVGLYDFGYYWDPERGLVRLEQFLGRKIYGDEDVPPRINARGEIAGSTLVDGDRWQAFVWSPVSGMELVPMPPEAADTVVVAFNDRGQLAGNAYDRAGRPTSFAWSKEAGLRSLANPPDFERPVAHVEGMNQAGDIVGYVKEAGEDSYQAVRTRFGSDRWEAWDELEALWTPDEINDRDGVVGWCGPDDFGCLFQGGRKIELPAELRSAGAYFMALNNRDEAVVLSFTFLGGEPCLLAYLMSSGTFTQLDPAPGAVCWGSVRGINDAGDIFGSMVVRGADGKTLNQAVIARRKP